MADDLDDALFSLAAGPRKPAPKKRSRKASDSDDDGSDGSDEAPKRMQQPAKGGGKRAKKVQSEDEDDSDFDDEEGLYKNAEDRRNLMAMTELERELILAERAETRDKERQRKQLMQQQRAAAGKADAKGRRKGDAGGSAAAAKGVPRGRSARTAHAARSARAWSDEDSDGGARGKSSDEEEFRPSSSGGSSDEEAAAGRRGRGREEEDEEEAGDRAEAAGRREGAQAPARSKGADRWGAAAAAAPSAAPPPPPPPDGGPGAEAGEEGRAAGVARAKERLRERERAHSDDEEAQEEASLEELLTCQVTRQQLEEWFAQPFFERDALSGCVVRMAYGPGVRDAAGGAHPGYMVMEITEIRESGRSYRFGPRGEATHKHLALRDGLGITRVMAMANVSSKPFDEAEFERYKRHCARAHRAPISREEAAAAAKKVAAAANYRWTSADLKAELERKRAARAAPVNPAAEKAALKRRLEMAAAAGAADEVAALEEQLASLESSLAGVGANARAFGMMDINARNKRHNLTVAYKTTAAEEHGANDGTGGSDVFSRRATMLANYWRTGAKGGGADGAAEAAAAAAARAQAALPDKLTRAQQRMDPADLLRQLGLDVDLSLLAAAGPAAPPLAARVLPARWRPAAAAAHVRPDLEGKSLLSIADWKRRAGEY